MTGRPTYAGWIAVDWGTSHLRAWAMSDADEVLAEAQSDQGMGRLAPDEFEPALLDLVTPWLHKETEVMACGMVGSRQGWTEAPYASTPLLLDLQPVAAPARDPRLRLRLIPGVKQENPPDVMRGEETQIAGFLARNPSFDGVLCLPGTHTKWAAISAGEITGFRSFMTGELYATIGKHTVLRHSVGEGWNEAAFLDAVSETLSRPEMLAATLHDPRPRSPAHPRPGRRERPPFGPPGSAPNSPAPARGGLDATSESSARTAPPQSTPPRCASRASRPTPPTAPP